MSEKFSSVMENPKQTKNLCGETELFFSFKNIHHFKFTNETTQLFSFLLYGTIHLFG